ncbi:tail protein X [Enterovibrio norvegicus]|uniref:tail protein X n=1 Tax=Enterovibrio norvegicus TaxID=188144 RepID=UPI0035533A7E
MATIYRTREGDVLDAICFHHYGRESAVTDVMNANPGLAEKGPILPSGLSITMPEVSAPVVKKGSSLWD